MKYGIIGCGGIGKRFAAALRKSPVAELYACAARDKAKAEKFASENGALKAYGSYEELINDPEVEAVYIATVHNTHAETAELCINAGKPVVCEKPFFINGEEADRVIALAKEKNVLIMEGFWSKIQPAYLKVKEWIRDGRIGDITMIHAAFCFNIPYNEQTKNMRHFLPETAGGALLDAGVYPYEYVTGIMDGEPDELFYSVQRISTGVDGTTAMILKYPHAIASCLTSITAVADNTAEICGTNGTIKQYYFVGSKKAELYSLRGELLDSFVDPEEEGFVHEIAHFTALVREGKKESDLVPLEPTRAFAHAADRILGNKSENQPTRFSSAE